MALSFPTDWAFLSAIGHASISGVYRCQPEDFRVDEVLGFRPSGEGEHLYCRIEKIGQNTNWVMQELSAQLGVKHENIGRSGLKDRHAVTTQWLSILDTKSTLQLAQINISGVRILETGRHTRKLRPGSHLANRFQLILRDLNAERDVLEHRLANIARSGFPNYFGDQRLGINGKNLTSGWDLLLRRRLQKHQKKGIFLSALRSYLFNQVLSCRVRDRDSETTMVMDDTGPLWGRGRLDVSEPQEKYETEALAPWKPLCDALEFSGLNQDRRALFVVPEELDFDWVENDSLKLSFSLPSGSYATSLLRELGDMTDGSARPL